MEPSYLTTLAEKRQDYEEEKARLEEIRDNAAKELKILKEQFDDTRKTLNKLYNHPTRHSIAVHRKRNGYFIRKVIGDFLKDMTAPYLAGDESKVAFTVNDDCLTFCIEVPFKHSAYEDIDE